MRLLDAFIPTLAYVRQFVAQPQSEPAALSVQLNKLLDSAQRVALEQGVVNDDVREAFFAVAAWTDEAVLTSAWPLAGAWQHFLLQRRHFGVSNAGEAFFERLQSLTPSQGQIEEVYLICLAMGFQGRYGHGGNPNERDVVLQAALQRAVDGADAGADSLLFPEGYAAAQQGAPGRQRSRWLPSRLSVTVVTGSIAALLAMYTISYIVLARWVELLLPQIR